MQCELLRSRVHFAENWFDRIFSSFDAFIVKLNFLNIYLRQLVFIYDGLVLVQILQAMWMHAINEMSLHNALKHGEKKLHFTTFDATLINLKLKAILGL